MALSGLLFDYMINYMMIVFMSSANSASFFLHVFLLLDIICTLIALIPIAFRYFSHLGSGDVENLPARQANMQVTHEIQICMLKPNQSSPAI